MCADHKLHQGPETPHGWRPENVQVGDGCFKTIAEPRKTVKAADGPRQFRGEEIVLSYIYSVSGPQKNMIDSSFAPVIQLYSYSFPDRCTGKNGTAQVHRHVL